MKTRVDLRLQQESARFAFRYACDDCAHFDADTARCSLQFPTSLRLGAIDREADIELCKAFELA